MIYLEAISWISKVVMFLTTLYLFYIGFRNDKKPFSLKSFWYLSIFSIIDSLIYIVTILIFKQIELFFAISKWWQLIYIFVEFIIISNFLFEINGIKNKNNPDLFKGLINKIKPDYLLSNILNFNINDTYDGTNGIIVQDKYVHPNQLKFTTPSLLLHYFKKYLNQYIYNTETKSNHSQIITFNDKYIIDGKFNYFKQYLENPNKVILITNIFYTPDDNHICEQINFDYNICNNDKILLNSLLLSLNDSLLNDNNNIFYNNVWEKYINKDELFKNKIKNNFKKLCNLYK